MKQLIGFALLLCFAFSTEAQSLKVPTLSPRAEIVQEVGLTEVKIAYSRPSAKGRKIWNGLVPYGQIWRTGANAATTISFTETVSIAGKALPAGTYALYTVPNVDTWTVIIHKNTSMRSLEGNYDEASDFMRFGVIASNSPVHVETFTIGIDGITTNRFDIKLSWADKIVKIPVMLDVHNQVAMQMKELGSAANGISHRDYFRAAEYNYHNDLDITEGHAYIVNALSKSKDNPRYGLMKAKIEAKLGKSVMAKNTLREAARWAKNQNNTNYINQIALYSKELNSMVK